MARAHGSCVWVELSNDIPTYGDSGITFVKNLNPFSTDDDRRQALRLRDLFAAFLYRVKEWQATAVWSRSGTATFIEDYGPYQHPSLPWHRYTTEYTWSMSGSGNLGSTEVSLLEMLAPDDYPLAESIVSIGGDGETVIATGKSDTYPFPGHKLPTVRFTTSDGSGTIFGLQGSYTSTFTTTITSSGNFTPITFPGGSATATLTENGDCGVTVYIDDMERLFYQRSGTARGSVSLKGGGVEFVAEPDSADTFFPNHAYRVEDSPPDPTEISGTPGYVTAAVGTSDDGPIAGDATMLIPAWGDTIDPDNPTDPNEIAFTLRDTSPYNDPELIVVGEYTINITPLDLTVTIEPVACLPYGLDPADPTNYVTDNRIWDDDGNALIGPHDIFVKEVVPPTSPATTPTRFTTRAPHGLADGDMVRLIGGTTNGLTSLVDDDYEVTNVVSATVFEIDFDSGGPYTGPTGMGIVGNKVL